MGGNTSKNKRAKPGQNSEAQAVGKGKVRELESLHIDFLGNDTWTVHLIVSGQSILSVQAVRFLPAALNQAADLVNRYKEWRGV